MRIPAILLAAAILAAPAAQQGKPAGEVLVRVETAFGNIDLAIDVARAPITAGNFLKYVDGGFYDGGRVHRATRADNYKPNLPNRPLLEIIQADINPARGSERYPAIPLERTSVTGLSHVVGTVSMPRGDAADSARSGFVIHLNDQPSLNHGGMRFDDGQGTAAFGRVVSGLDVVRTIQKQPVQGQSLTPPVEIRKVYRLGGQAGAGADLKTVVAGLHGLSLHDQCTGDYPPQPDTCIHQQRLERTVTVGGKDGVVHDVTLRIQGIVEPTIIEGGETPYPEHPYYRVGGSIRARDWSAWHIEVSNPPQTYWLNHYPKVSHTIYKEDFEATIPMAAGATVTVRVIDGNDRQIDNAEAGRADRLQIIKGLSDTPLAGQMLKLDVLRVTAR